MTKKEQYVLDVYLECAQTLRKQGLSEIAVHHVCKEIADNSWRYFEDGGELRRPEELLANIRSLCEGP